jgi:outer membrane translocation and assembly module TamA
LESQEPEEESYEVIRKRFFDTVQKQKNETSRRKAIDTAVKDAYKDVNSDVEIVNSGEEVVDGDFTYKYESEVDEDGNLDLLMLQNVLKITLKI